MARSKTPRSSARKAPRRTTAAGKGSRPVKAARRARRKPAQRARPARKAAGRARQLPKLARRRPGRSPARPAPRTPAKPSAATRKAAVRKVAARKVAARKPSSRKGLARKIAARKIATRKASPRKDLAPKVAARKPSSRNGLGAAPKPTASKTPRVATARKAPRAVTLKRPALDRERRRLPEADHVPTPPSTLDFNGPASAARSGQIELADERAEHSEADPSLTGGDVDADWQQAYSSGDEAPGGDNPTPDQDIVDEIGRSLGLVYEDDEELKGAGKLEERDRHRWELDPASAEDFEEH
jgi:Family of unknown function (DUF6335)